MLNIYSDEAKVPHNQFFAIMSILRRLYIDRATLDNLVSTDRAKLNGMETLMLEYMNFYSDNQYEKFTQDNLMDYLINYENIPASYFLVFDTKKKKEVMSMDVNTMNRLIRYGVSPYLMEIYKDYQAFKSKCDNMEAQYGALMKTDFVDNFGTPVWMIPFYYTMESTGRIYSKSVDVQGISHRYDEGIVALKDYFLIWGDFAQIDLRVAFELCLTGDDILVDNIHKHPDRYEAFSRTMHTRQTLEFAMDTFLDDRDKYKAGILAPIYGMGREKVQSKVGDKSIGGAIFDYINSNPKYQAYKENVLLNIDSEVDYYCTTYFGTKMPISQRTANKYTASLNKPIQGTSGDIMKIVTVEIYNRMMKHLKDKNLFVPLVNRHDETVFMIHKSALPYMYEFIDCTQIQIDDWAPLEIKWNAGYCYGKVDEDLENKIKQSLTGHTLTKGKKKPRQKPYNATPKTVLIHWSKYCKGDFTFNTFLSFYTRKALSIVEKPNTNTKDAYRHIQEHFKDELRNAERIILYNDSTDYHVIDSKEVICYKPKNISNYHVEAINKGLVCRYITNNLKSTPEDFYLDGADIELRKEFDYQCQMLT